MNILLTANNTPVFKWVVWALGELMNGIFNVLNVLSIPNVGLAIILFTIVIYLLLTPLTIKQQRFSKLSAKMNPEIQAIQAKYKGKNDNESMIAMNEETKAVYAKYGVSPSGSCVQLLIQMPILFALYRVIYNMPAYVDKIGEAFGVLADKIMSAADGVDYIRGLTTANQFASNFNIEGNTRNAIIDVLNKLSSTDMAAVADKFDLSGLTVNSDLILSSAEHVGLIDKYNYFLGLNIGNNCMETLKQGWTSHNYILVLGAVVIPVLAALTQWINVKLMPQPSDNNNNKNTNSTADTMAQSMKTMNMIMPLMSAYFCFILPAGMGIYWVAGAVVRSIQQVIINKHLDKMDIDAEIKKNLEKYNEKLKKQGIDPHKLNNNAKMNTKKVSTNANRSTLTAAEREEAIRKSTEYYNKNAKPGSLASKANMVKQYNEKNNK